MAKVLTQAAVAKAKAVPGKTRIIKDGASRALFLVIQSSGHKSWLMRWRRTGGGEDKIVLGPVDQSGRRHDTEPVIGQPLTLTQARQLAAKLNADRAAGVDVGADHRARKHRQKIAITEAANSSFSVAVKDFVEQHAKPKTRGWKETATLLGLTEDLGLKKNGLADRWSDRDVRSIDSHDLFSIVEEARRISIPGIPAKRDGPSENRARKVHAALSQLYSWLLRKRRIELNPMATLHAPAAPSARDRVLSSPEISQLWAAINTLTEPFGDVIKLLLLTGARLNEIAQLQWEEIGLDGAMNIGTLNISGARTKNKLTFIIPLPPLGRQILSKYVQDQDGRFVFSTTGGTPISGWSKIKRRLDTAMGDVPPWRLHDIRRSVATHMAGIGIPPHVVEAVLNHVSGFRASVAGTYNRHSYSTEKREALQRWADHLDAIVSGRQKLTPIRGGRP
jgi:integrase